MNDQPQSRADALTDLLKSIVTNLNAGLPGIALTRAETALELLAASPVSQPAALPLPANETGAEGAAGLAHELWTAAQLAAGEGIEDGVRRISAIVSRSPAMAAAAPAHKPSCASLNLLLLSSPPKPAPCDCGAAAPAASPVKQPAPAPATANETCYDDAYPETNLEVIEKAQYCLKHGETESVENWLELLHERLGAMAAAAPADERAAFIEAYVLTLPPENREVDPAAARRFAESVTTANGPGWQLWQAGIAYARTAASPAAAIQAGWKLVPIERSYEMRAKALIAFNTTEKAGGDRDDALDAAYRAELASAPQPAQADASAREPARRDWDETGERCVKCGDKDWFAGPHCSESRLKGSPRGDAHAVARERDDPELIAASNKGYAVGLRDGKALAAANAETPADAGEARLTDEQREAIKFAATWFDQSVLPDTPYCGYSKALRALLNGNDQ
ncbi:hypothetical protein WT72_24330 [Burkholderia pseudomultivorans]|uniref:hypothetical protein n=1 Tax=Burkholderia pseudomultivorans TaxID=1207504 RepID=UPI00075F15A5|nr:hypothetical protein [Burkholderia pseudomultivorans]KWI50301.1 hypothetical protein WT72_24330 [Burkholderia pseudomultivorans]